MVNRSTARTAVLMVSVALAASGVTLANGAPALSWLGTSGYMSDGCSPDNGNPNSTSFVFKVKYTDPGGMLPLKARLIIAKRVCQEWKLYRNFGLTPESGSIGTGAVYSTTQTLPNEIYKYRFRFQGAGGTWATGDPNQYSHGPFITARPKLCWSGLSGFVGDGVEPNSAAAGSKFRFQVRYQDSYGDQPYIFQVLVRRNGVLYKQKDMMSYTSGGMQAYRLGVVFTTSLWVYQTGTYEYRFRFRDLPTGYANGPPAAWNAGPTITGGSGAGLSLTSCAAVPTNAGAQVAFSLSQAAEVAASVTNVAGRPVRTLATGKAFDGGAQTLLWDGKTDTGTAAPPGLYLIRLTARSADGAQASGMATLSYR